MVCLLPVQQKIFMLQFHSEVTKMYDELSTTLLYTVWPQIMYKSLYSTDHQPPATVHTEVHIIYDQILKISLNFTLGNSDIYNKSN